MSFRKIGKNERRFASRRQLFENILIVTDGEQTEANYFNGLRDSFPLSLRRKIRIKVENKINTQDLVETAIKELNQDPNFREAWIVFDRDDRPEDFDAIIAKAKKNDINTGWSNPCIEIFFHTYFEEMPHNENSQKCILEFSKTFKKNVGKEYKKNDEKIYDELFSAGDEHLALVRSENALKTSIANAEKKKPSNYCPASALYKLVDKVAKHRS